MKRVHQNWKDFDFHSQGTSAKGLRSIDKRITLKMFTFLVLFCFLVSAVIHNGWLFLKCSPNGQGFHGADANCGLNNTNHPIDEPLQSSDIFSCTDHLKSFPLQFL